MGKRFTPTHISDQRAIRLYLKLREIERDFPLILLDISKDQKIVFVHEKDNRHSWNEVSVETVLSFNLSHAKKAGGTRAALMGSSQKTNLMVPSVTVADAVQDFLTGDDSNR